VVSLRVPVVDLQEEAAMVKLYWLWLSMVVVMMFVLFPYSDTEYSMFPYSIKTIPIQNYVYYITEHLVYIIFTWVIYTMSTEYRIAFLWFFWLQVFKLADYLVCYNKTWVRIWNVPFNSNVLCIMLFTMVIFYYYIWRNRE
jgi:hypothetical protein